MDRRDTFNHLFDAGFDYETYAARSDRHDERMKTNYRITGEFLSENSVTNVEYINKSMKFLWIAENWCGDCGHGVPIIAR
ncbi:MAG: thioredoxin family protein, partial [Candidatus Heimdallarchaeota archaeon]|nr:thioredoxin family protein [Candidatus Heimdallarchaeota archaeon]